MVTQSAVKSKEKSIRLHAQEVHGIVTGRQSQLRRVLTPQPPEGWSPIAVEEYRPAIVDRYDMITEAKTPIFGAYDEDWGLAFPFGRPGDRIWGKESWNYFGGEEYLYQQEINSVAYRASHSSSYWTPDRWWPAVTMPRWASRLTLEITGVRVERLQDISEDDAIAQGAQCAGFPAALTNRGAFGMWWIKVKGRDSWSANPAVWVMDFKVDQMGVMT